ncbi:MAG: TRZ/ATZ family hydrolase [Enterobacterales bacterium]|nr:TRZ/ATZ family hydrolase [Enterobacterales bacterium]
MDFNIVPTSQSIPVTKGFAIAADWIIPMQQAPHSNQANNYLEKSAVVVENDLIVDVIEQTQLQTLYPGISVNQLGASLLLPGFVNAHCHAAMSLLRGVADDSSLNDWLNQHIWPLESQWVDNDFVYEGSQLAIAEMLLGGTSCFQDSYLMPDQVAKACQQSGIRSNIGLMVVESSNQWAQNADECIDKGLKVFDQYKHNSRLSFSFAPHSISKISSEALQRLLTLSNELSLPIVMHLHETAQEITQHQHQYQRSPLESLQQLGLLSPLFNAVHMTQISQKDQQLLKQFGCHVVHCPQSNMKLGSGICPVTELLQQEINLALGTDGAASNNSLDMLSEIKAATLLAKLASGQSNQVSAYQILYAATMGGAKALGLDNTIGSLEKGKQADILALDMNHIETMPLYDPISQLVYSASRKQVQHLWVAGQALVKDGQLTQLNNQQLIAQAKQWQQKIKGSF